MKEAVVLLDPDKRDDATIDGQSFNSLSWPANVQVTENFLFATAQRLCLASIMRMPSMMLAFQDGSVLLVSEREAEYVTRALSSSIPMDSDIHMPALIHFEFARSALPKKDAALQPMCPVLHGGPLPPQAWAEVARGVVSLQLFAGDTSYSWRISRVYRFSSKDEDATRQELVKNVVFGAAMGAFPSIWTTRSRAPFGRLCLMTYRSASLFQRMFSPCTGSAACICAYISALGVLLTYRLARLLSALQRCAFEALKKYSVTRGNPKSASYGAVMVLSHRMHYLGTNKHAEA
jgi:hypothetical protein